MKRLLMIALGSTLFLSCEMDRYEFTMKAIKLNHYHKSHDPDPWETGNSNFDMTFY